MAFRAGKVFFMGDDSKTRCVHDLGHAGVCNAFDAYLRDSVIQLTNIPMPPSMNHAYATNQRTGHRFKSREMKYWQEVSFRNWALLHREELYRGKKIIGFHQDLYSSKVIKIDAELFFPKSQIFTKDGKPKRNDSSNRLKILHDAIAGALRIDDCLFFDGSFTKRIILNPEVSFAHCNVSLFLFDVNKDIPK